MKVTLDGKISIDKRLLWDTDPDDINIDEHARWLIHRVITRGGLDDWHDIRGYYGMAKIKYEVLRMREIDPKTLSLMSTIFGVPQEKFRCYRPTQSSQGPWRY